MDVLMNDEVTKEEPIQTNPLPLPPRLKRSKPGRSDLKSPGVTPRYGLGMFGITSDPTSSIDTYEDTIKEWRRRGAKVAFIYDLILDTYRKRLDFFTLLAFLLTSLTSLLALSNFGISEEEYPNVAISMKALNVFLTTGAAICAGIVQLRGWNQLVNSCQKYLDTVENFVAVIISEQTLPLRLRMDPEQFILQQKDKFQTILNSAPDIPHDHYLHALKHYEQSKTRFRHDIINL